LAQAYWLNLVGFSLPLGSLIFAAAAFMLPCGLVLTAAVSLLLCVLASPWLAWQFVGAFRAAVRHTRSGASVVGVGLGWLGLVLAVAVHLLFADLHTFPWAREQWSMLTGDKQTTPMKIELLPNGREVELTGGLPAGCAREFSEFLAKVPSVTILQVNKGGGRIYEALAIAKVVSTRGMTTCVSVECESAATLIFLAGHERIVANGAKVGFHSGAMPGLPTVLFPQLNDGSRKAMLTAGVDPDFVARALSTPSEKMWYPPVEELLGARVATGTTNGERFAMSRLVAREIEKKALTGLLPGMAYITKLREAAPEVYREMEAGIHEGIDAGLSEGALGAKMQGIMAAKLTAGIPFASDESLGELLDLWIALLERYKDTHPKEALTAMGIMPSETNAPAGNIGRVLPDYPVAEEGAATVDVIASAAPGVAKQLDADTAKSDLARVFEEMKQKEPDDFKAMLAYYAKQGEPKATAHAFYTFYATMRSELPRSRQANVIRYTIKQ